MSATRQVAFNTVVQVAGRAIIAVMAIIIVAFLTRYLGVAGYGQYATVFAYVGLVGVLVDFGFFLIIVREITQKPEERGYILGNVLGLRLVAAGLIFFLAYLAAGQLGYSYPVLAGIAIASLSQTFIVLNQVPVSLFQSRLRMDKATLADVAARFLMLVLTVLFIRLDLGFLALVAVLVIGNFFAFLVNFLMALPSVFIYPRFDFAFWGEFLKKALPMGVVVVLAFIYFRIDVIMLSLMKGDFAVGVYAPPYKIVGMLLTFPTIFMSSVFPIMTKTLDRSFERAKQIFRRSFDFLVFVALPMLAGVLVIATPLMVFVAGADFAVSGPVLGILIFAVALSFINSVSVYTLVAAGKQGSLVWPYVLAALFNVTANWLFIPYYSYIGAAYTTVATELIVLIYTFYLVARELKFHPSFKVSIKSLFASLIMGGLLYLIKDWNFVLLTGLGAIIYIGLALALKAFPKSFWKEIGFRRLR